MLRSAPTVKVPLFVALALMAFGRLIRDDSRIYRRYCAGFGYRLFGVDWTHN